jgi:hypothetical protein
MGLLDDRPFDPSNPRAQYLLDRLGALYNENKPIRAFAIAAGVQLNHVYWEQRAELLWPELLAVAADEGCLRLLITAVMQHPDSAAEKLFRELVNEPWYAVGVPVRVTVGAAAVGPGVIGTALRGGGGADVAFETSVLFDDLPLIDRQDLRDNVRRMVGQGGRRTLLVQGGKGMGKTYTRQFIRYVSERRAVSGPRYSVGPVDASTRAGSPIDVRELVDMVALYVVGTTPPNFDPTAQPQTVVTLFRTWLISEAEKLDTEPVRWLIFDGFDSTTATSAALQLVAELAESASTRDLGPVRVIVLGFDDPLAQPDQALVEPLRHPSDDDVKAFFSGLGEKLQGVRPDDDAIELLFDNFTRQGGPIADRQLCELGPSAFDFALTVFGAPR